jgi:hypothetical protein
VHRFDFEKEDVFQTIKNNDKTFAQLVALELHAF